MQRCYGCMKEYGDNFNVCPHCGYIADTVPESKYHLKPGTCLADKYVLGKVIGHGGFGITYIAYDKVIQKRVAVKEFFPNAFSTRSEGELAVSCYNRKSEEFLKDGIRKMLEEAKRLSRFSSTDNVVDIFDFFEANNTAYIVMEYLDGKDLKKLLEENGGSLKPEKAIEIILPVLNALEDMHKENVIHRDISPDNIFICTNGKVKLLDFGSARLAVDDSEKSLSVMVKRGYAPREQYASRSKQGPWTDVYAACATLYRMITGETPLESTERDEEQLKPFSTFGIKGFDSLENLIAQGLVVDYTERIQNVEELKNGLNKILEGKKPVGIRKKKSKKAKKQIKMAIAVAAAVAVVIGAAFAVKHFAGVAKKPEETTTTAPAITTVPIAEVTISREEAEAKYTEFIKSEAFAKENPAIYNFYENCYEKANSSYNGSGLVPADLLVFDSEPIVIQSGLVQAPVYFDLDGDTVDEMLLEVKVKLPGEKEDRSCVALFDMDTEKDNEVRLVNVWKQLSSVKNEYNHLLIMEYTEEELAKNTDLIGKPSFYFAEYSFKNEVAEDDLKTEDYSKDCRKSYYNGKEIVTEYTMFIADYHLKGIAQPNFVKCTVPEKSLYMADPDNKSYPTDTEIERITYEDACNEWDKLFGNKNKDFEAVATKKHGYCDSSLAVANARAERRSYGLYNMDIDWAWYKTGGETNYLLFESAELSQGEKGSSQILKKEIKTVGITSDITGIDSEMFKDFTKLTEIVLHENVKTIADNAFENCGSLKYIGIPKNVTYIGENAFKNCESLTEIYIPANVTNIASNAFDGCESLERIIVDEKNAYYASVDGVLFNKDKTELVRYPEGRNGNYSVPESVSTIGTGAFKNANVFTLTVPKNVTYVRTNAFENCMLNKVDYKRSSLMDKPAIESGNDVFDDKIKPF